MLIGAGSLDRADWTRASRRCICAVRERMWEREVEAGILWDVDREPGTFGAGVLVVGVVVATRVPGGRLDVEVENCFGFGVILWSAEGRRDFRTADAGVFAVAAFGRGTEASDMGGDGGS